MGDWFQVSKLPECHIVATINFPCLVCPVCANCGPLESTSAQPIKTTFDALHETLLWISSSTKLRLIRSKPLNIQTWLECAREYVEVTKDVRLIIKIKTEETSNTLVSSYKTEFLLPKIFFNWLIRSLLTIFCK